MNTLDEILARLDKLDEKDRKAVMAEAEKATAGMFFIPNPGPQTQAYFSPADLLYYGGSAGGGKSMLLLGLALNEHRVSRLFRRQFKDIDGEGGLVPTLAKILGSTKGYRGDKHVWTVPNTDVRRTIEFAAFSNWTESEAYQGRAADFYGYDEAVQFQEDIITFLGTWNRTVTPGQRVRTVLASNPPLTPEGLWIFDWFAPWLDPQHPNPAAPGELRWFARISGVEVEVDAGYRATIVDASGNEIEVKPQSRTFVPASLSDNPDLMETDYASTLAKLPKHLQDAMLGGKFKTTMEDAERQVIPTDWILKAQQRWTLRKHELQTKPCAAVGADMAESVDRMVVVPLHGTTFGEFKAKPGKEVATTDLQAAFIMSVARDGCQLNIDCGGGYGGGVASLLESNGLHVVRCKGGEASRAMDRDRTRRFANKRAEWIWRFREALHPEHGDNVALPPSRDLLLELTAFREKPHGDMRDVIMIEDNETIAKRIGRSPDIAWAHFFAWAEPDAPRERSSARPTSGVDHRKRRRSPPVQRQYAKVIGRK